MDVGKRIRQLRENKGWEQLELAKKINISQSKMNKIETGFQKRIEPELLVDLSNVLGATVDYIVGNTDNPDEVVDPEFEDFIQNVRRWYKEAPKDREEDLQRLKRIFEAYKNDEWHHGSEIYMVFFIQYNIGINIHVRLFV